MDESAIAETALRRVRELLDAGDVEGAKILIEDLLPADRADVFEELELEEQRSLLPTLDVEEAAEVLEEMEDVDAAALAAQLNSLDLARILDEMEPDEAADVLGDLDAAMSQAALARMVEAEEVRPLLVHPDESAGGLMTTAFLAFPETMTVRQALTAMRSGPIIEAPRLFVVDEGNHLVGAADLFLVLRSAPDVRLVDLVDRGIVTVHVDDDQEAAARLMVRYDLAAVPVVDGENCLVGAITADDLVDVLEEEATEDVQRLGGAEPLARSYRTIGVLAAAWKRVGWLYILFVAGTLSSSVMGLFEEQLEQAVVLAFFVPLLIDTGGNAGSQTIATVVRALANGDITMHDGLMVVLHELRTSLALGVMLAVGAFLVGIVWAGTQVALAIALSILGIVVWAATLGAVLPLFAVRVGLDPALVSGPLLTTVVDATGLLMYFSIASAILGL